MVEDDRTGLECRNLKQQLLIIFYLQGKFPAIATKNDFYAGIYRARSPAASLAEYDSNFR